MTKRLHKGGWYLVLAWGALSLSASAAVDDIRVWDCVSHGTLITLR